MHWRVGGHPAANVQVLARHLRSVPVTSLNLPAHAVRPTPGGGHTGDREGPSPSTTVLNGTPNDVAFVAKLAALSFAGGAAVKWGSLLTPVAFGADPLLATLMVAGPPAAYAAMLVARGSK